MWERPANLLGSQFIILFLSFQTKNRQLTTDLQNQRDKLKSRDVTVMFVLEEESNKNPKQPRENEIKRCFNKGTF